MLYFRGLLCFTTFVKWCHQESNRGHKDFQSFALPTELWHRCFCLTGAKVDIIYYSPNNLTKKCSNKLKQVCWMKKIQMKRKKTAKLFAI